MCTAQFDSAVKLHERTVQRTVRGRKKTNRGTNRKETLKILEKNRDEYFVLFSIHFLR